MEFLHRKLVYAAVVGVFVCSSSCLTNRSRPSLWPPGDFRVEVVGMREAQDGSGRRVQQRFCVDRDGFALYREADDSVDDSPLPVFDSVSSYRMAPESVRSLARLMDRAGLFELDRGQAVTRRESDPHVVVKWTAFERTGQVSSFIDSGGVLNRVVHVVNSFLPESCAFTFPELLSGELEPRHVTRAPEPLEWVPGALICHRQLVAMYPEDRELLLDLFALACVAGDADTARAAYQSVEALGPMGGVSDLLTGIDRERDGLAPMRELIDRIGR